MRPRDLRAVLHCDFGCLHWCLMFFFQLFSFSDIKPDHVPPPLIMPFGFWMIGSTQEHSPGQSAGLPRLICEVLVHVPLNSFSLEQGPRVLFRENRGVY